MPKAFPFFLLPSKLKMMYMYDTWESNFKIIERTILKYKINILFISNLQSNVYFNNLKIDNFKSSWVPEGINNKYYSIPYSTRKL